MSGLDGFFHNLSDEENSDGVLEESVPSQATPVVSSQQHRTETFQPVMQLAQPCSFSATPSYPQNFSAPSQGYPMGLQYPHMCPPNQYFPFPYGLPPYGLMTFPPQQIQTSLRNIAPKPDALDTSRSQTRSSSRPPDFIETVKLIRKQLYDRGGIEDSQEPPAEGEVYSRWRKSVIEEWKPHNMSHYMMVAKLSRRCFNLVTQMPERLKVKVTQADFIDLYGKHEKDQFELLSNLLEGRISFKDLKSKRRRREKDVQQSQGPSDGNIKELEEEISRLKSQNADLRTKLEEAIEERDKQKSRAEKLQRRIKVLERENEEEFQQYRNDVDALIDEKNSLGASFLSHQSLHSASDVSLPSAGECLSSDLEHTSTSSDDSKTDEDDDNVPLAQVANKKKTTSTLKTSTPRGFAEKRPRDKSTGSSSSSSEANSEIEMNSESQRLTQAEKLRTEAKKIKKKLLKNKTTRHLETDDDSSTSKDNHSRTTAKRKKRAQAESTATISEPQFQDEWDYNIQELVLKEWVAVAYERNFYVGKIEKKFVKTVGVTFLTERNGIFQWPQKKDWDKVAPEFIFCRNVEVIDDSKSVQVKNLTSIKSKFRAFCRKYFGEEST